MLNVALLAIVAAFNSGAAASCARPGSRRLACSPTRRWSSIARCKYANIALDTTSVTTADKRRDLHRRHRPTTPLQDHQVVRPGLPSRSATPAAAGHRARRRPVPRSTATSSPRRRRGRPVKRVTVVVRNGGTAKRSRGWLRPSTVRAASSLKRRRGMPIATGMAAYAYNAINSVGLESLGEVHAPDPLAAREQLRVRGLLATQPAGARRRQARSRRAPPSRRSSRSRCRSSRASSRP